LYEWDRGNGYEAYTWRSKEFVFPYDVSFAAAKVVARCGDNRVCRVSLLDGACRDVLFDRAITNSEPFRLPVLGKRTAWTVQLQGSADVQEIHFATSLQALTEGAA
jgi:hypothetical protein